MSAYMFEKANALKKKHNYIVDVRGLGLMMGIELNIEGKKIFEECFNQGLIINCTQGKVLRLMPALNVTKKQINSTFYILDKVLGKAAQ